MRKLFNYHVSLTQSGREVHIVFTDKDGYESGRQLLKTFPYQEDSNDFDDVKEFIEKDKAEREKEEEKIPPRFFHKRIYPKGRDSKDGYAIYEDLGEGKDPREVAETESYLDVILILSAINQKWEENHLQKQEEEGKVPFENKLMYIRETQNMYDVIRTFHSHEEGAKDLIKRYMDIESGRPVSITMYRELWIEMNRFINTH